MRAIRKSDGKVIEVEKAAIGYCEVDVANINGFPMQNFYSKKDLDFDLPEEEALTISLAKLREVLKGMERSGLIIETADKIINRIKQELK